mmetsp:Transcript_2627/g.4073  ORF Transcript_2627/g.4073 Transcript_2627/m.4073 type:complete len:141 (-) Transcript_2627:1488-1910(-)
MDKYSEAFLSKYKSVHDQPNSETSTNNSDFKINVARQEAGRQSNLVSGVLKQRAKIAFNLHDDPSEKKTKSGAEIFSVEGYSALGSNPGNTSYYEKATTKIEEKSQNMIQTEAEYRDCFSTSFIKNQGGQPTNVLSSPRG